MSSSAQEPIPQTLDIPEGRPTSPVQETLPFPAVPSVPVTDEPAAAELQGSSIPESIQPTIDQPLPSDASSQASASAAGTTLDEIGDGSGRPTSAGSTQPESPASTPTLTYTPSKMRVVGGYEIIKELGRGGMGVVYQAVHRKLKRTVALKMILAGNHAGIEQLARFRLEAEAIARLRHPHIVQIFEIGDEAGNPYFALEFVDGGSLDRYRGTPQPARHAAELVAVLASAMHAAHQAGVIHRDLKPGNVLLSKKTDAVADAAVAADLPLSAFEPKITDFGLAKQLDTEDELSRSGAVMGTPSYMAPEQAEGRIHDIGPATDVYALAAVLYDLLTGRPPFKGATAWETVDQVRTQEPVPPSRLLPKVPRDLEIICLKGLRKDVRQRYGSAQELAADLRRFLAGQPIQARPISTWERAWKWARREPTRAAAIAAAVLALVAGAAGTFFYGLYKEQQAETLTRKITHQQEVRQKLDHLYKAAAAAEKKQQFSAAKQQLVQMKAIGENDPDAVDDELRLIVDDTLQRVERKLGDEEAERGRLIAQEQAARLRLDEEKKERVARDAARQDFAGRSERFGRLRDEVIFHAVSFRDQDRADDLACVRQAAPAALEAFALDVTQRPADFAKGLERFRPIVEAPGQLDALANDCYQILLAWSAAEAATDAAEGDGEASPQRALNLLDRAGALAAAHGLHTPQVFHLRRAGYQELLGDAPAAKTERELAAAIEPTSTIDLFESALNHYRKGEVKEAAVDCQRVFPQDPNHFWTQYLAALCDLRKKDWGVATVRLSNCLDKRPGAPWLLMHRALAHAGNGLLKLAEDDFEAALSDAAAPAFRAVVLTNRSFVWVQLKRWPDAERDLLQAIALQPKAYQSHVNLALVYQQQGKRAEAVQAMDEAVKLLPERAALYLVRARLQLTRGDTTAARRDFENYLTRAPKGSSEWAEASLDVARVKLKADELNAALADCDIVIQGKPDIAAAHCLRAEVLIHLDRLKEAGLALDRYLALGGKETREIERARGLLDLRSGKNFEALEAFNHALVLSKEAETYSLRGWTFLAQEAPRPALADFDAALALDKVHTDARRGRATALVLLGRAPEAEDIAEEVLKDGTRTPELLFQVACIYSLAVGKRVPENDAIRYHDRALELLQEAVKRIPDDAQRRAFWQQKVEKTAALVPIRGRIGMRQLAQAYGSKK